jgi:LysR family transcriptional regulator, low CO2-responsive transcriptional regulator
VILSELLLRIVIIENDWLQAFAAFAEHRSFTHAARTLHLSQPAVHVQVKKLEGALGVALYERRGRELVLTDHGQRTLAYARETLERSHSFLRELHGESDAAVVRLCAGEGAFLYLLGDALHRMRALRLSLRVADAAETVLALQRGEVHIGVAPTTTIPDGIQAITLVESSARIAMPARHPLAHKRSITAKDLDGERLIVPPTGRPMREALDVILRAADVSYEPIIEARGWPLTLRLVELGMGIALVNDFCSLPRGVISTPMRGLPRQTYRVMRRASARHSKEAAALFDALAARRTKT